MLAPPRALGLGGTAGQQVRDDDSGLRTAWSSRNGPTVTPHSPRCATSHKEDGPDPGQRPDRAALVNGTEGSPGLFEGLQLMQSGGATIGIAGLHVRAISRPARLHARTFGVEVEVVQIAPKVPCSI